jgi:hypothetical protein
MDDPMTTLHPSRHAGYCPVSRVWDAKDPDDCACGAHDDAAADVARAIIDESYDYTDDQWQAILSASAEAVANAGARYFVSTSTAFSRRETPEQPRDYLVAMTGSGWPMSGSAPKGSRWAA